MELPELHLLEDYRGNWSAYFEALYELFALDFIITVPRFRGEKLRLKRHPIIDDKEATFWHMISEGSVESERTPDIRRCERIRWPSPMIVKEDDPDLKVWSELRGSEERVHIWHEEENYVVILACRSGYYLPWTAYTLYKSQKEKMRRRYNRYKN